MAKLNYHVRERIGPKQSLTKEGWLLCEGVPIARTGQMVYGDGEVPLPAGPDGVVYVDRFPEDVFRAETVASVNGKDVVDEHPDEDVKPENWRRLSAGVVLNPRRGEATEDDLLLADLLVKAPEAIEAVRGGKREVSCGYDADYIQALAADGVTPVPGRGKQINILMNHVALVDAGRCGPRCAIGDRKTLREGTMSWIDKVKAAFAGKDEAALNAALAEAPTGAPVQLTTEQLATINRLTTRDARDHGAGCDCEKCKDKKTMDAVAKDVKDIADKVTSIDGRVKKMEDAFEKEDEDDEEEEKKKKETEDENRKIEGSLEEEAPPGTSDGVAAKAKDSAYLMDSWAETVSLAEVIAPGCQVPAVDAKADPKKTFDTLCRFRRTVLDLAAAQPDTRGFMDATTGGRDYKRYTCDAVRQLFRAVGNFKKAANNAAAAKDSGVLRTPTESGGGTGAVGAVASAADINKRNAEYYRNLQ